MSNTIAQNLNKILTIKNAIKNAIIEKGGTVNKEDSFEKLAEDIMTIPSPIHIDME